MSLLDIMLTMENRMTALQEAVGRNTAENMARTDMPQAKLCANIVKDAVVRRQMRTVTNNDRAATASTAPAEASAIAAPATAAAASATAALIAAAAAVAAAAPSAASAAAAAAIAAIAAAATAAAATAATDVAAAAMHADNNYHQRQPIRTASESGELAVDRLLRRRCAPARVRPRRQATRRPVSSSGVRHPAREETREHR